MKNLSKSYVFCDRSQTVNDDRLKCSFKLVQKLGCLRNYFQHMILEIDKEVPKNSSFKNSSQKKAIEKRFKNSSQKKAIEKH